MTDAGDISAEIGQPCVADHDALRYWVPDTDDVSDLPTVDGFDPTPEPTIR